MSIPNEVIRDFSAQLRERGGIYFAQGKVRITHSSAEQIVASVQGREPYSVEIELGDRGYDYRCTCHYATEWEMPCKHAWATIVAADRAGLLTPPAEEESEKSPEPPVIADEVAEERLPAWKARLRELRETASRDPSTIDLVGDGPIPEDRRIIYLIDVAETRNAREGVIVEVMTQKRRARQDAWERPRTFGFNLQQWFAAPEASDRLIAQMLVGATDDMSAYSTYAPRRFIIVPASYNTALKLICETGRCGLKEADKPDTFTPLRWDAGSPYDFVIEIAPRADGERAEIRGAFRRDEEIVPLTEPRAILPAGLLLFENRIASFHNHGAPTLLKELKQNSLHAAITQVDELVRELCDLPRLPVLEFDPSFHIEQMPIAPKPIVRFRKPRENEEQALLRTDLNFDYGGQIIDRAQTSGAIFDAAKRRIIRRDSIAEDRAMLRLKQLGVRNGWVGAETHMQLPVAQLHTVVMKLIAEGWDVLAEGAVYRKPGAMRVSVGPSTSSGIDWFELSGGVEFDGTLVALPRLLAAVKRGENTVKLDDGSIGLLPVEWLEKYAPLAGMGSDDFDDPNAELQAIRFSRAQVGLLDAMLATMPEANVDETFARVREEVTAFQRVQAIHEPTGFVGELRPYQRDGLGWLAFLQKFNFGGCLADDMGLGKTIMVLALLEMRREQNSGPSLVVVPRSLVFNWMAEAAKFAPKLRILDHSGINRTRAADHFSQFDLIITTYGTLRRDAIFFKDTTFDYAILDEAQAIKNATTEAAKATRLLQARHRLALSGTPIENRLAELWSLFEFLNPGMLGGLSVFQSLVGNGQEIAGRQILARALRPFILRRTKAQVAKDLPEKLEQTIHCDLEPQQRKLYDELREHYRQSLLGHIEAVGLNRSKIQILEALLRLRQAACHPGLIDATRINEPSAKLEALLEHLTDVLAEGHKALVFSQFTSFLSIVRKRLDDAGTTYEYLDGKTRDRQQRVERFQSDENCKLFLISLKAGGVGLNLTAADYVFLLDPWWNPAVESQAIDRTHRIGQTRRVFAYRLIARDTVEEKVLKLQKSKRDLADAIITADNSVIGSLKREDLELLLS